MIIAYRVVAARAENVTTAPSGIIFSPGAADQQEQAARLLFPSSTP